MRITTTQTHDDRGASDLLGVVLLFGIVIAGSAMLVEVGESTTESTGEHFVNVEVTSVSAESESDDHDD